MPFKVIIFVNVSNECNKYHYLVCGCIVFHCGRTDVRTDIGLYGRSSLGHLLRDDLKMGKFAPHLHL